MILKPTQKYKCNLQLQILDHHCFHDLTLNQHQQPLPFANKRSCFWQTTSLVRLTQLNLRLSLSFTGLLLAVKYSSEAVQTVSSNISHQTWKSSSDWKITQWSPQSNYAGLVYDLSAHIHYPQLQNGEQPFNFSFQLAHHFPDQVVMSEQFTFSFSLLSFKSWAAQFLFFSPSTRDTIQLSMNWA